MVGLRWVGVRFQVNKQGINPGFETKGRCRQKFEVRSGPTKRTDAL